jgi:hypothetical protein
VEVEQVNNWAHKLANIDVRVLQIGLIVVVVFALLRPMGLAIPITNIVKAGYDTIDALPAGSIAVFACSTNPGTIAEHTAMSRVILKHLISKNVRVVLFPSGPQATTFVLQYSDMMKELGCEEGVDFIVLPFRAGEEKHYAAIGSGFKSVYEEQPSSPLWDDINDITSVSLWIDVSGGDSAKWAMAHIGGPKNVPIVAGVNSNQLVLLEQYFASGQLAGAFGGLGGAAQYEQLSGLLGEGAAGMDAQALGYCWMILLIILGNVGYLSAKKAKASPGGAGQ